ncbi:UDP-glucosyltransferase 2-like [Epargyreus clarus]|uniref:UDP-glucosyltransferase 2-like n=1 Tax=Epargyreus clarus TaxID=520877 RepID=UPI003C2F253E
MASKVLLVHSLLSLLYCDAYKILLVFPVPSRSHSILGEGYVKLLAQAGHEITYITPMPMKHPPSGVRQIDISENKKYMPIDLIFDSRVLLNQEADLQKADIIVELITMFAYNTLRLDNVQKLLDDPKEEFDAVVVEWLYTEMFSGLAAVYNCPLIWSSSMVPHSMVLSLVDEYPNPSYTTHHLSRHYGFSFWERVRQLWTTFNLSFLKWSMLSQENSLYTDAFGKFVAKRGRVLPPYQEVRYNASLVLGNSYIAVGDALRLPQNYKSIGGYHIEEEQEPLSENLQKIMSEAKHGVIYFSMGSMLKSSRIPDHLKKEILNIFGALNQTVIWKFEEVLADLPKNVHILPWAPQTSILAHPNCILFITHGGLLSKTEALHFGVPIIGIPLYGDQFVNINRAELKGFGKKVDLYNGAKKLEVAIREILENPSYRERTKEYSFIYHHRPISPRKELVHWVEHVIQTGGALHLRSPALIMPWYQKYYLDLAAVILALSGLALILNMQARKVFRTVKQKTL